MTLIRAFGEFWRKEALYRRQRGSRDQGWLPGTAKINGRRTEVDVWRQRGIYVLLSDYKPVYVGQASDRSMGSRLRDHLTDRHAGRWDMFSWYGVLDLDKRGAHGREPVPFRRSHGISRAGLINTLESLAIAITDPPLNRARARIPEAVRVDQAKVDPRLTAEGQLRAVLDWVDEAKRKEARARLKEKRRRRARGRTKRG
jgi:hypothetical protein